MKKTYQKPDVELIKFDMTETLLDEGGDAGLSGSEGWEEW